MNSEASARPIREYSKDFVRRPSSESNGEGREGGFIEEERDTQRDTQKGISGARLGAATKEGAATDEGISLVCACVCGVCLCVFV